VEEEEEEEEEKERKTDRQKDRQTVRKKERREIRANAVIVGACAYIHTAATILVRRWCNFGYVITESW